MTEFKLNDGSTLADIVAQSLSDAVDPEHVHDVVIKQTDKMIEDVIKDLFSYGDVKNALRNKLTEIMVPAIERHNFDHYAVKLEAVLNDLLNATAIEQQSQTLLNFRDIISPAAEKELTLEDILNKYTDYVETHMDTSEVEADYEGYCYLETSIELCPEDKRSWLSYEPAILMCKAEEGDYNELNIDIPIYRWTDLDKRDVYHIDFKQHPDIYKLRSMSSFEIYLMKHTMNRTPLIITDAYATSEASKEKERD